MSDRTLTEKQTKLLKLADYIERLPDERFDMRFPVFEDGAGCIACHAEEFFGTAENIINDGSCASVMALCMPPGWQQRGRYTKSQAVATLRHFAMTGDIDWSVGK